MTRHLLMDSAIGHGSSVGVDAKDFLSVSELTPEEASTRWERHRIMPCEECSAILTDAVVYHEP